MSEPIASTQDPPEPGAKVSRPTRGRRKRRVVALAMVLLLGLGASTLIWAQSPSGTKTLLGWVAIWLRQSQGVDFSVDAAQADFLRSDIRLRGLKVTGIDGQTLFTAKALRVRFEPVQLLTGRLRLEQVQVDAPRSYLVVRGGRIAGLPSFGNGAGALIKLSVTTMQVHNAAVEILIEDRLSLALSDINIHIRGRSLTEHDLSFSVGGGSAEGFDKNITISAFSGAARQRADSILDLGQLDFERFVVGLDQLRAELSGRVDFSAGGSGHLPEVALNLHADVPLDPIKRVFKFAGELDGLVQVEGFLRNPSAALDPKVDGILSVTSPKVSKFNLGDLNAYFQADLNSLNLPSLAMAWGGGVVVGSGAIQFNKQLETQVQAAGEHLCFGEILADMGLPGSWVNFYVDGKVQMQGPLLPSPRMAGQGSGTVRGLVVNSRDYLDAGPDDVILATSAVEVSTGLAFDAGKFQFRQAVLRDGLSELHGAATLNFDVQKGLHIELEPSSGDIASVQPIAGLGFTGHGQVHGVISGPYTDPHIEAFADLADFSLARYQFGQVLGNIGYRQKLLSFTQLRAQKGHSDYHGDVELDFHQGLHLAVEIGVDKGLAEEMRSIIPVDQVGSVMSFIRDLPLEGGLAGLGVVRGNITGGRTEDLKGSADLQLSQGHLYGQSFAQGVGRGRLSKQDFFIDTLELNKGAQGRLSAAGTIARSDGALKAKVQVTELGLDGLEVLKNDSAQVKGLMQMQASFSGTVSHILATGTMQLGDLQVGDVALGNGQVQLGLDDVDVALKGTLYDGKGPVNLGFALRRPFPFTLSFAHPTQGLAQILPASWFPDDVSARAEVQVQGQGKLSRLAQSQGQIVLTNFSTRLYGIDFKADKDLLIDFTGPDLRVQGLTLYHGEQDQFTLRGLYGRQRLDLDVEGHLDMALVPRLTPQISAASGQLNFAVGINGPRRDPVLLGQGTLQDGQLTWIKFEHPIKALQARFSLAKDALLLDSAQAKVGGSAVLAEGALRFAKLKPNHLDVKIDILDSLTVHIPKTVTSTGTGHLRINGELDHLYLTGALQVESARYTETWDVERILPEFKRRRLSAPSFDPEAEFVYYDLALHADKNLVLRNNLLDVEYRGDLRLTGTNERPGLRGTLNLIRGSARFRGNRYDIEQGTVDLVDPYDISPIIDVLAHTRTYGAKNYDIDVALQGPLDDLRIRFDSDPKLAQIDILSLVTLGFIREDLRDVQTTGTTTALEVFSAYSGLDREVKRVLPLAVHEVRLSSIFSDAQGTTVPSVVVGIELLEGLQLQLPFVEGARLRLQSSLQGATGGSSDQRVELDVRLNNRTSLRGVLDNDAERNIGDPGLDLNYRLEF